MSETFTNATKVEEIGRDLKDLHGVLVLMRDSQTIEEQEIRAAISAVAKSLACSIAELGELERQLYQLEQLFQHVVWKLRLGGIP